MMRFIGFLLFILFFNYSFSQDSLKRTIYKWDLFRAVQGTFQVSTEKTITNKSSLVVGLMGTYASTRGLAKPYLKAQDFTYKDAVSNVSYNLDNIQALGFGIDVQLRKYLEKKQLGLRGFYIAPEVFYRKLFLESEIYNKVSLNNETIKRKLNLGYLGYSIGYQKIYKEMLAIDGYVGGGLFLSKYEDENNFTRYRHAYQLDYSGIYFNMGILVGILN
jgi:hypothetical protein